MGLLAVQSSDIYQMMNNQAQELEHTELLNAPHSVLTIIFPPLDLRASSLSFVNLFKSSR